MKKKITFLAVIIMVAACQKTSAPALIIDKSSTASLITGFNDPGIYASVKIGSQRWMNTNLTVRRYRNGDPIPQVTDATTWASLTTGAWCWYKNDSATYAATYGRLYNWYAVNDPRGLAPTGWHLPTNIEWDTLSVHLGTNVGGKLKDTGTIEAGTGLWLAPNTGATNKTGFTGLPGGARNQSGFFFSISSGGFWWSSTQFDAANAWYRSVSYKKGILHKNFNYKLGGFSVRCIRD